MTLRKMNIQQCFFFWKQALRHKERSRQCLTNMGLSSPQQFKLKFGNESTVDMTCPKFFCDRINRLQKSSLIGPFADQFNFRMSDRNLFSVPHRFPENYILYSRFDFIHDPGYSLEPYQFKFPGAIHKMPDESFLKAASDQFHS